MLRRTVRGYLFGITLLVASVAARADDRLAATMPVNLRDEHVAQNMLQLLGDKDFSQRQKGQALLDSVAGQDKDILLRLANQSKDNEVKVRLLARVGKIEEIIATDPPPITLKLQDASSAEVAAALGRQLGIGLASISPDLDGPFTVNAQGRGMWDILRELKEQQPLTLQWAQQRFFDSKMMARMAITRGVAIGVDLPHAGRAPVGRGGRGNPAQVAPSSIAVNLTVALDPRIAMMKMKGIEALRAEDNLGNVLELQPPDEMAKLSASMQENQFVYRLEFAWALPANAGDKFNVKGEAHFVVQTSAASAEIANARNQLNKPVALGDGKATIRAITRGARTGTIHLEIVPDDASDAPPRLPDIVIGEDGVRLKGNVTVSSDTHTRIIIDYQGKSGAIIYGDKVSDKITRITVNDALGKQIANYTIPAGKPITSLHVISADFQEPLRFVITTTTKSAEVTIPFEFKDLPLGKP